MRNIYTRTFVPSWFARKGGNTSGWGGGGRFISTASTRRTLFQRFLEKARYDPGFRNKLACRTTLLIIYRPLPPSCVNSGIDSPLPFSTPSWRHLTHEILLEVGSLLDFNYWREEGGKVVDLWRVLDEWSIIVKRRFLNLILLRYIQSIGFFLFKIIIARIELI